MLIVDIGVLIWIPSSIDLLWNLKPGQSSPGRSQIRPSIARLWRCSKHATMYFEDGYEKSAWSDSEQDFLMFFELECPLPVIESDSDDLSVDSGAIYGESWILLLDPFQRLPDTRADNGFVAIPVFIDFWGRFHHSHIYQSFTSTIDTQWNKSAGRASIHFIRDSIT